MQEPAVRARAAGLASEPALAASARARAQVEVSAAWAQVEGSGSARVAEVSALARGQAEVSAALVVWAQAQVRPRGLAAPEVSGRVREREWGSEARALAWALEPAAARLGRALGRASEWEEQAPGSARQLLAAVSGPALAPAWAAPGLAWERRSARALAAGPAPALALAQP